MLAFLHSQFNCNCIGRILVWTKDLWIINKFRDCDTPYNKRYKGKWLKGIRKGLHTKIVLGEGGGPHCYCDRCPKTLSATSSVATSYLMLIQFSVEWQKNGNSWGYSVSGFTRQMRYNCRPNSCSFDTALFLFSFFNTSLNILQK